MKTAFFVFAMVFSLFQTSTSFAENPGDASNIITTPGAISTELAYDIEASGAKADCDKGFCQITILSLSCNSIDSDVVQCQFKNPTQKDQAREVSTDTNKSLELTQFINNLTSYWTCLPSGDNCKSMSLSISKMVCKVSTTGNKHPFDTANGNCEITK
jgi:hypothetical protein